MNKDLRQTREWGFYLNSLGWETHSTSNCVNIEILKKFGMGLAKIQRPGMLGQKDIDEIEDICEKNKCMLIKIEPSDTETAKKLESMGYKKSFEPLSPASTLVIDLTKDEMELWADVSSSGRYGVNRAKRQGIRTHFYRNPADAVLADFYKLYSRSTEKKSFKRYSPKDLKVKASSFGDNCFIGLSADRQFNHHTAAFYLSNGTDVWYMHGGKSDAGSKTKAGYLLFWEAMLYFKELGFEKLDLEGVTDERYAATREWKGFTEFKRKFGGTSVTYPGPYVKITNRWLKYLDSMMDLKF